MTNRQSGWDDEPATPLDPPRFEDVRPSVGMPSRPWALPLAIVGSLALGGVVLFQMSEARTRQDRAITDPVATNDPMIDSRNLPPPPMLTTTPIGDMAEVPAAQVPLMPPPATAAAAAVAPPAAGPPSVPTPEQQAALAALEARRKAPALIYDGSDARNAAGPTPNANGVVPLRPDQVMGAMAPGARPPGSTPSQPLTGDEQFAQRVGGPGGDGPARASQMGDLTNIVLEGTIIPGVLETAINSDLPGFVRAAVSRDIRGYDNKEILIPRGSRLIGQYRSGVALGQSRAFIIWTRLITPEGVSVPLASPGTDELGRGGLEGRVDRHFLRRFGGAIVLSLISAGANAVNNDADTQVVIASTRAGTDAAGIALQSDANQSPTIKVDQGASVRIFVARDLDFSGVR
jgi:type IV secretory pathway VirB10-like protein